jgi:SAM-dependent methyltransferase
MSRWRSTSVVVNAARMDDATLRIKAAYADVQYDYAANVQTHPDRLATMAALHGVAAPSAATSSILEIGCGDGANLLPMAAQWPHARLVGCDLAEHAVARGMARVRELALSNLDLRFQDLRDLPSDLGPFDYVIAHGFYSWVPEEARQALFSLLERQLAPNGVAFVSFNALPGSHVRQVAWDAMHFHGRSAGTTHARLARAREFVALLAEPAVTQHPQDAALREELAGFASRSDSALQHDDLAVPNEPCYFHQFMARAAAHGIHYICDTEMRMNTTAGVGANARRFLAGMHRLDAEQYLDFLRFRRFRQALLTKAQSRSGFTLVPGAIRGLQAGAAPTLVRAMDQAVRAGKPRDSPLATLDHAAAALARWLVESMPGTVNMDQIARWRGARTPGDGRNLEAIVLGLHAAGLLALYAWPEHVASVVSPRPLADRVARATVRERPYVANLRHESVDLSDPFARSVLALLDGTRDRAALLAELGDSGRDAATRLDATLQMFAQVALLRG